MHFDRAFAAAALFGLPLIFSCTSGHHGQHQTDSNDTADTADTADTGDSANPFAICTDPVEPPCVDDMILALSLHEEVTQGEVTTSTEGTDFLTVVDARAGGSSAAADHPWVYFRFDTDGAHRVDIGDETALESMDWHVAVRRFQIRLNGGDSGPSCVGADRRRGEQYEEITKIPGDASFDLEDFYDDSCELQMDAYGMSPKYLLGSWWTMNDMCVSTTLESFLIQLDDGRVLKLRVDAYYESGQEECNTKGVEGHNSGVVTFRWQFLG
jgi:hypothetical protein